MYSIFISLLFEVSLQIKITKAVSRAGFANCRIVEMPELSRWNLVYPTAQTKQ